jgi:hypothetical protein
VLGGIQSNLSKPFPSSFPAHNKVEVTMLDWYRTISDSDRNPLKNLPPAQRFQMMTMLGLMWTAIFCAAAGAWIWFGEIVVAHLLLALGALITGLEFRAARQVATYRDYPNPDGTARYDDLWGA